MKSSEIAGYLGAAAMAAGVFAPVMSAPIVGSINLFHNGQGDGTVILAAAAVAALFLAIGWHWLAVLCGAACTVVVGFDAADILLRVREAQGNLGDAGALGRLAARGFQIEWGWLLLIGGAVSLMGGSLFRAMGDDEDETPAEYPTEPPADDPEYVSIDAFARAINRTPATVLKGIKAGVLVGRFNGSEWQVHRSSLPRKRDKET